MFYWFTVLFCNLLGFRVNGSIQCSEGLGCFVESREGVVLFRLYWNRLGEREQKMDRWMSVPVMREGRILHDMLCLAPKPTRPNRIPRSPALVFFFPSLPSSLCLSLSVSLNQSNHSLGLAVLECLIIVRIERAI